MGSQGCSSTMWQARGWTEVKDPLGKSPSMALSEIKINELLLYNPRGKITKVSDSFGMKTETTSPE